MGGHLTTHLAHQPSLPTHPTVVRNWSSGGPPAHPPSLPTHPPIHMFAHPPTITCGKELVVRGAGQQAGAWPWRVVVQLPCHVCSPGAAVGEGRVGQMGIHSWQEVRTIQLPPASTPTLPTSHSDGTPVRREVTVRKRQEIRPAAAVGARLAAVRPSRVMGGRGVVGAGKFRQLQGR